MDISAAAGHEFEVVAVFGFYSVTQARGPKRGLTKRSYSTGTNLNQRGSSSCNKRLKTAFITFAKGYLSCNKDGHLGKYHQHLLKRGMSRMEALMRVARGLARDLYRQLRVLSAGAVDEEKIGKSVA